MSVTYVNERPLPLIRSGDGPGTLFNRDTTRPVYIGSNSSILEGNFNSASILDPRASMHLEGGMEVWVCAPVGTTPDNAVAVDYISSGRSEHFVSPDVLAPQLQTISDNADATGQAQLALLGQILQAIQNLNIAPGTPGTVSAQHGTVQLVNGTATVPAAVPASASIAVTYESVGANSGTLSATPSAGGFTITSSNPADDSTVYWIMIGSAA